MKFVQHLVQTIAKRGKYLGRAELIKEKLDTIAEA